MNQNDLFDYHVTPRIRDYAFMKAAPTAEIMAAIPRTEQFIWDNNRILCSISGGADSDIMLDMVWRLDKERKVRYTFCDTGIEMEATKRQLAFLENKYGIKIETLHPKETVGAAVRKYGYPFHTKQFSEYISRLQKHGFKWEDKTFDELYAEYPDCKAALRWWCNNWKDGPHKPMQSEIGSAPYLKEFMITHPPTFAISPKCCDCAKKRPSHISAKDADITLIGIRKAEGGTRSTAYKSCFVDGKNGLQHFPLF